MGAESGKNYGGWLWRNIRGNSYFLAIIHLQFINTLFINRFAIYDIIIVSKDNTQTDRKDDIMKIKFPYVRIKAWKDDEMKSFLFLDTSVINTAKNLVKGVYQNA